MAAAFRRGLAENGFIEGQNGLRHVAFQDDYRLTFASLLHQGTCANTAQALGEEKWPRASFHTATFEIVLPTIAY